MFSVSTNMYDRLRQSFSVRYVLYRIVSNRTSITKKLQRLNYNKFKDKSEHSSKVSIALRGSSF